MTESAKKNSQRRGRQARKRDRATTASAPKAVWPGLSGGQYAPLSAEEITRIHNAALHLLETVGLSQASPSMVERVTTRGGEFTPEKRLLFPQRKSSSPGKTTCSTSTCRSNASHIVRFRINVAATTSTHPFHVPFFASKRSCHAAMPTSCKKNHLGVVELAGH